MNLFILLSLFSGCFNRIQTSYISENIISLEQTPLILCNHECNIDLRELQNKNEKRLSLSELPAEIIENILSRLNVIDYANFLSSGLDICRSNSKELDLIIKSGEELNDLKLKNEEENKKIWQIRKSISLVLHHIVKMKKAIDKVPQNKKGRLRYYAGLMEQIVREIHFRSNKNSTYFLGLIFSLFVRQPLFLNIWKTGVTKEFKKLFTRHVIRAMAATGRIKDMESLLKESSTVKFTDDLILEWALEGDFSVDTLNKLVSWMSKHTINGQIFAYSIYRKKITLSKCVQYGRLDLLEAIMKDSSLDLQKVWATDLFIIACEWGHQDIAVFLWQKFHCEIRNRPKRHEAVFRAAKSGNIGIIQSLLFDEQFSQLPNDESSQSVFDPTYQEGSAVLEAAKVGRLDIIKLLLAADEFLWENLLAEVYVNKAIIAAASGGHLNVMKYFLAIKENGVARFPVESIAGQESEAFIEAATNGHVHILEYFLNIDEIEGAVHPFLMNIDPTAKNNKAFRRAAQHGHLAVMQFLLSKNIDGSRRFSQIDPAAKDNDALRKASRGGHLSVVKYLLEMLPHGLFRFPSVNPAANNNEPLIQAAKNGHVEIVKFLLQRDNNDNNSFYLFPGINAAAQNNRALIEACSEGHLDVVKELLRLDANGHLYYPGIDPSIDANEPLISSVSANKISIIRFLLSKRPDGTFLFPGVNPHARNNLIEKIAFDMRNYFLIKTIFLCSYGSAEEVDTYLDNPLIASIENEPSALRKLSKLAVEQNLNSLLKWCNNLKIKNRNPTLFHLICITIYGLTLPLVIIFIYMNITPTT